MKRKKEYPGYLLYFDRVEGLLTLSDEELGRVHRMLFYYARDRKEPEEIPDKLALIWPILRSMLNQDREAYEEKCRTNSYTAACRVAKERGEAPPTKEQFNLRYEKNPVVRQSAPTQELLRGDLAPICRPSEEQRRIELLRENARRELQAKGERR